MTKNSNISKIIKIWEEWKLILYKIEKTKNIKIIEICLIINLLKINIIKIKLIYRIKKVLLTDL
jgi:hypothetical protein